MPAYVYFLIAAGSFLWCLPFVYVRVKGKEPFQFDRRARWGVGLQCIAYSLLWQGPFWTRSLEWWRVAISMSLFLLGCLLSWTAARSLGRHFRVDAAVDSNQELVRSGPYRLVRHPIYTSMLCVLLGTGFLVAPIYLFAPAILVFLAGTEIRMRVEDRLLASRFGKQFREYQRNIPRLIPLRILR
jgi:protein-S-isoprenylcysteine O-methyltransferase Ste14